MMRNKLIELGYQITGCPSLLRIYWYDAATDRIATPKQREIAKLTAVKLRLGRLDKQSGQKGVDSLIVRDLMILSQERAMSDAVLIGGDEDLREGVADAQDRGIRVYVVGIKAPKTYVARTLQDEADGVHWIDKAFLAEFTSIV
jgi:uncharacterized LabA/DUF88 family protein